MSFVSQRVLRHDGNILSKTSSGMQSGGEEEQDEEAHTPLPPPMEIIKDPSAQDDKVPSLSQSLDQTNTSSTSATPPFERVLLKTTISQFTSG